MLTPFRFTTFAMIACFFALGSFDTVDAQSLTVNPASLAFTAAQGGNPSSSPTVMVGTTNGSNVSYLISTSDIWISASSGGVTSGKSGNAPDTLYVQILSTSLPAGSYNGTITLTPTPSNGTAAVTIAVALTVGGSGTASSTLSATPSQLSFGFELGHAAPPSQTVQILSSGISLPFTFSITTAPTSNCPASWLQVTGLSSSTPAVLTVSVATAGLAAGSCTGNILVSSNTPGNGTTTTLIGIVLFVSTSALLNVNIPPGLSSITLQQKGAPVQFNLQLTSSDSTPVSFTASVPNNNWLAISPSFGTTPTNIDVQVTPGSVLPPGTYNAAITINSTGLFNNTTSIPIQLILTSSSSLTVTPSGTQNFTELQGGSVPASQTLTLTGAAATTSNFTTSVIQGTGGAWLQIGPGSGSLVSSPTSSSAQVTLSVAPNTLPQGVYSSQAVISFTNSTIPQIVIAVSLTVAPPASAIVATPAAVTFSYQSGGTPPAAQSVTISNPASGALVYTVASISDSWISVNPSSGATPGSISVGVNPQVLQTGSYTGSFTLTSPGVPSTTVNVSLFISASQTPQPFIIGNAASGVGGQLAPGEIISIKGSGLGPGTPVSFTLSSLTNPTLGGVGVTFDGTPGTLLYVSSTQINVTVPYEVAGRFSTNIVVTYQGVSSAGITQPVGAASVGLFTDNATGGGQAAVVNQNYTYNTAATPAPQGSYISVYATGGGQTVPASFDGEVSPTTSLLPLVLQQNVTAAIGGKAAAVVFAGEAPGYVTGVVQFNIQVPTGVSGTALPIVVTINGSTVVQSQNGATVAVQ